MTCALMWLLFVGLYFHFAVGQHSPPPRLESLIQKERTDIAYRKQLNMLEALTRGRTKLTYPNTKAKGMPQMVGGVIGTLVGSLAGNKLNNDVGGSLGASIGGLVGYELGQYVHDQFWPQNVTTIIPPVRTNDVIGNGQYVDPNSYNNNGNIYNPANYAAYPGYNPYYKYQNNG